MPSFPILLLLTLAAAQPEPPPIPPLPDISPLAPPGWSGPAVPSLPMCPPPPDPPAPAAPGLTIADIPFAPDDIASAEQTWEEHSGQPAVRLILAESGRRKFQDLQRSDCEGQVLEIRVDGDMLSSPVLRERIEGADIMISGSFTVEEAAALAARLGANRPD